MSALTPAGSTYRWRLIRAFVLARDLWQCRIPVMPGVVCGAPASCVDHIVSRKHGGTDHPANLRAACTPCNLRRGAGTPVDVAPGGVLTPHQMSIVVALDAVGAPADAGRRIARRALSALAICGRWSKTDVDAACAFRRSRAARSALSRARW